MTETNVAHDYQWQLKAISDNATVALFIMDERQRCVFMNPAAERLTGFAFAELQGKTLHDFIHHTRPDGSPYPLEECPIDRAFPANNQEQGEEVFVRKDGTFYTVAFTASPIRDGATVTGTVIEVRDISEQKRREREGEDLRESLEIALKSSNAAVWEVDLVNKTVKGDAYLARLFNVPLEKCINGTSLLDDYLRPIHEEDIARVERVLGNSIANGEPFDVDYRIVQPDKSSIWVAARGVIVRDKSNTATRFHGLVIDITERKRIQEQLQTSEARHRLLIDSAQDFAIITLDLDGFITTWNAGAQRITGFSETEVIGKKADIFFTPEDCANDVPSKEIATALRDGRAEDMRWHLRKTGARFFANGVMVSVKDDAGNVRELLKIMRDETAGKLNENRLHESERRYRTLFESINDGFCVIEKIESKPGEPVDFLYTEANPAFAAQSGIKDVIGKTIRRVIPGEADEWIDIYDAVATTGKAIRFDRELVTLGRVLELYAFRVEDETHRRVAVIFTDITNRKRAEEDLRESQARLRFTLESANVGDWDLDLVTGKAQRSFLHDKCFGATTPFDDWSYERFLTFVHPADVERVKRDFGQALTEQKDWHFECRVVWADGSVHWIEGHGSVYRTENGKPARMLGIVADITERKRAEQALRESEVRYRTVAETASDAIIQINERSEILFINQAGERIFGYKVEEMIGQSLTMLMPEHTHAAHRAGMQRHLETGKRHLSWAGIELPGHRRDGSDFPLEISFGEFNQDGKRFFIGIARDITARKEADDESDTSEMLKVMLARCGAQITLAASADEVLKNLKLTDFDILISDIGMPHRDGYELITEIRRLPVKRNGNIPAIALTAYARTEDRLRALRSGYQMHVPKPVELAELVAVIASLASRHGNGR